jgi:hypothetical protein
MPSNAQKQGTGHLRGSESSVATKFPKEEFCFSGAHVVRKKVKFRLALNHSLMYKFSTERLISVFEVTSLATEDYGLAD